MAIEPFSAADEGGERLAAFVKAMWTAFVPPTGRCVSVQGELIRVSGRLFSDLFQNGFGNFYAQGGQAGYRSWAEWALDVLLENKNQSNSEEDLALLRDARNNLQVDETLHLRLCVLQERFDDEVITPEEDAEFTQLQDQPAPIEWEATLSRLERCAANWILKTPELINRTSGAPVQERGVRNVNHVFEPAALSIARVASAHRATPRTPSAAR